VRYERALGERGPRECEDSASADQVTNVRNDPFGAGLNEQIVVELIEILLQHSRLFGDYRQQRLERTSLPFLLECLKPLLLLCGERGERPERIQFRLLCRIEQIIKLTGKLDVADSIDCRKERIQPFNIEAHFMTSSASGRASSVSSSAGNTSSPPWSGKAATIRVLRSTARSER